MNCHNHPRPQRCIIPSRTTGLLAMLCTLAASFGPLPRVVGQDVPSTQAGPLNALLLKNDRVMQGDIERRGDFYCVKISNQSAVTIPKTQVESVGQSINEIYIYKLRSISRWSAGDHFKLTRWCIVNNMLDEAALHYGEVAKEAGDHPRVKQLAIELKNQMLRDPDFRAYLGLSATDSTADSLSTSGSGTPTLQPSVVTASANMRVVQHPQIVQRFSERIQPILINRCSQSACHGGQSNNRLQLLAPYARGSLETSSKNLASVLGQVSESSVTISPLLAYATRVHGIQRKPAIAVTETELVSELQNWISFVQNPVVSANGSQYLSSPRAGMPTPMPATLAGAENLQPVEPGSKTLKQVPKAEGGPAVDNLGFPAGEALPTKVELDALEAQINAALGPPQPRDPFDPAEFNRRTAEARLQPDVTQRE